MPQRSLAAIAVIGALGAMNGAFAQQVTRVTLYPGSATVERAAHVNAGNGRVELTGLPANFDPRTLRVDTDAGIQVGEVTVKDASRSQALGAREAELEKRIAALEGDLGRLRSGARDMRSVAIAYSAAHEGELRASYQVMNAGWRPQYRAALDSNTSRVELVRQAAVMQRTGEDWRGGGPRPPP